MVRGRTVNALYAGNGYGGSSPSLGAKFIQFVRPIASPTMGKTVNIPPMDYMNKHRSCAFGIGMCCIFLYYAPIGKQYTECFVIISPAGGTS